MRRVRAAARERPSSPDGTAERARLVVARRHPASRSDRR
ncbi:MAG: hypothetical protein AVDCRST_MAG49-4734 [uncultured Thermomicrobiales bacterium]|uniref:Uncharacterized protein n=1 Tax=uncultured Thermomicrobiales bacterium TaxID=1645740 RepID=A0A6J4VKM9_9BACT|nr:MAG: hypothetical protein AVDCRST_MAG49-4734 [uncultured Thermomicrobiales bacterium]